MFALTRLFPAVTTKNRKIVVATTLMVSIDGKINQENVTDAIAGNHDTSERHVQSIQKTCANSARYDDTGPAILAGTQYAARRLARAYDVPTLRQ
jgi:hypothetical protein